MRGVGVAGGSARTRWRRPPVTLAILGLSLEALTANKRARVVVALWMIVCLI